MSGDSLVSVVILSRNAGPAFERTLRAVREQRLPGRDVEIVVVDSGSTDGTPDAARRHGAEVIAIAPEAFNHGATRNLGIEHSHGALVACLVQDACPASFDWLAALVRAVEADPLVAGAYSRQLPWPEDDALTAFLVGQWHRVQGERRVVQALPPGRLADVPYAERRRLLAFDNVSAVLRRELWARYPFRPVPFAEDMDWAKRVLQAGYRVVYEPDSQVYHSHVRPFAYHLRRQYVEERVLMDLLEADDATMRSWNAPGRSARLVQIVMGEARRAGAAPARLWGRTVSFATATMLGSLARRVVYSRLRSGHPPGWARRLNAWLSSGI